MATAYHRDQPGAPALTYSTSGNAIAHFTALKTILKACLVEGYAALPAAGWELIAEGADYLVMRNGSHTGYVCLTWAGGIIRIYLSETYTGMAGSVMTGDGLKTGTKENNAAPHCVSGYYLARASDVSTWSLVADERTFVLAIMSAHGSTDLVLNTTPQASAGLTLYVGEDSSGNFIAIGGEQYSGTGAGTSVVGRFNGYSTDCGFTVLKDPNTGMLVDKGSIAIWTPQLRWQSINNDMVTWIYAVPEVRLNPIIWGSGGEVAGNLRGVALPAELTYITYATVAACALGYPGDMTIRNANTPIDLGDGHTYFVRLGHYYYTAFFLLTDNPEFW